MARLARIGLLVGLFCAMSAPAHGFGWRLFGGSTSRYNTASSYYASYYPSYYSSSVSFYPTVSHSYLVPVYSVPVPVVAAPAVPCPQPVKVVPAPAVATFATPTPAPPSQTKEPPISMPEKSAPKVKEGRSFYPASLVSTSEEKQTNATCKVGFWNLSNQVVTLQVNGQAHLVEANRAVTLVLPRQFVWQINQQTANTESIPADRGNFEIVLR